MTIVRAIPASHPAADLFPTMDADEFSALVESIREHGQQEPITMHEDKILDGRHRWRACVELGIEPLWCHWAGACGTPTAFVMAMNLNRRHLSSGQRAAVATEFKAQIAAEIQEAERKRKQEQAKTQRESGQRFVSTPQRIGDSSPPSLKSHAKEAATVAAKAAGTNRAYVEAAEVIKDKAPDIFESVKAGTVTIPEAKREVERREIAAVQATVERAIQADPDAEARLAAKRLHATYAAGWSQFQDKVLMLNADALALVFGDNDWSDFERHADRCARWFEAVRSARPRGLRVVGG